MRQLLICLTFASFLFLQNGCSRLKGSSFGRYGSGPLADILKELRLDTVSRRVLDNKALYEVQIIYTQIDRDAEGRPHFRSYEFNVDSSRYFYPASMMKLPYALLSLERIRYLQRSGFPALTKETPYRIDSLRPFQQVFEKDSTSPSGKPNIAHDIRQIFAVSDNIAPNRLCEFLGIDFINEQLAGKGFTRTGMLKRYSFPERDNRYTSPMTFYKPTYGVYKQGEIKSRQTWTNPQHNTTKGRGYYQGDSLIWKPFDMSGKNWFALNDMEKMIRAVMFPNEAPEQMRFQITDDDYAFVHRQMGGWPRECTHPKYLESEYPDNYCKFLWFGEDKGRQSGAVRSFNKIGEAYGTLTDAAYIVDFAHQVEFILAATILCNADGVFNDDKYDYEQTGVPFLARLGQAVWRYEVDRPRQFRPDLTHWKEVVK
ncbi:MAG: serine hydrolase [Saprospiraceae bacterium]|nr:serine hydrolase [Saprospiraceae bacterium]